MIANEKVALIQTPQFFRGDVKHTWVEKGAGEVQELFYRWGQVNRDKWNASICVGSNATYRRAALVDVGGTAAVGELFSSGGNCASTQILTFLLLSLFRQVPRKTFILDSDVSREAGDSSISPLFLQQVSLSVDEIIHSRREKRLA